MVLSAIVLLVSFLPFHDNNLPPLISALGFWNDTVLSLTERDPHHLREFCSGHLVAFRGYPCAGAAILRSTAHLKR
ncbi:hypothetical protein J3R30DRAFT_2849836 [Lentinula aciculospora]|uniref:Uncharacterized protein n=1 Tax=Lentinula aciculospora TaxID=153920 RepID=A0A9W9AB59_9AGAR|nr:hypothetical protein J3R30DRAFT_2849836 [Lentinula aciculospora]